MRKKRRGKREEKMDRDEKTKVEIRREKEKKFKTLEENNSSIMLFLSPFSEQIRQNDEDGLSGMVRIAQVVEQRTEDPHVTISNMVRGV